MALPRVAIVGSGVSGLAAAHALKGKAQITLFEAADYFGGHAHTVEVTLNSPTGEPITSGVDTGFLVFNERTYPGLIQLFEDLGVDSAASDMSFSVQAKGFWSGVDLEWCGSNVQGLFAQKSNLLRPRFWFLIKEILRFNRLATEFANQLVQGQETLEKAWSLGQYLQHHRFGRDFQAGYLLPMLGCIWSCPTEQMLAHPAASLVRFCHNHGLLQVSQRPKWFTPRGGSKNYVDKIVAAISDARLNSAVLSIERGPVGVLVVTAAQSERFDAAIVATHAHQALSMLKEPLGHEREILGAIHVQSNEAVLHTDTRVMPKRKNAWAAWNFETGKASSHDERVCLHYWLNCLQPLPFAQDVFVTLNPLNPIAQEHILGRFNYDHPVLDQVATNAQARLQELNNGLWPVWFAGAWMGYGFHEDGFQAGLRAAQALEKRLDALRGSIGA
jgi:predicted NAD/FAD-binding protein